MLNTFCILPLFLYDCPLLNFGQNFREQSLLSIKHFFKEKIKDSFMFWKEKMRKITKEMLITTHHKYCNSSLSSNVIF